MVGAVGARRLLGPLKQHTRAEVPLHRLAAYLPMWCRFPEKSDANGQFIYGLDMPWLIDLLCLFMEASRCLRHVETGSKPLCLCKIPQFAQRKSCWATRLSMPPPRHFVQDQFGLVTSGHGAPENCQWSWPQDSNNARTSQQGYMEVSQPLPRNLLRANNLTYDLSLDCFETWPWELLGGQIYVAWASSQGFDAYFYWNVYIYIYIYIYICTYIYIYIYI